MKLLKFLPGMNVKILDRKTLVVAGYEENSDPEDFLNLISGKEITIKEEINDFIYTCVEFPDVAIYKVFIEKIVHAELTVGETALVYGFSSETIRRAFNSGIKNLKNLLVKNDLVQELIYE